MKTGLHKFKHTFAKKWINNGGDIFRLQKILGHSSLDEEKLTLVQVGCNYRINAIHKETGLVITYEDWFEKLRNSKPIK